MLNGAETWTADPGDFPGWTQAYCNMTYWDLISKITEKETHGEHVHPLKITFICKCNHYVLSGYLYKQEIYMCSITPIITYQCISVFPVTMCALVCILISFFLFKVTNNL